MLNIFNRIFQVLIDIIIGIAVYFGLKALIPVLPDNAVIVVTLIATSAFAEFIEMRLKK